MTCLACTCSPRRPLSLIRYGEAESDVLSSFARSGRLLAAAMRDEPEKDLADLVRNDLAYEDLLTNLASHRQRTADALAVHSAQLEQLRARLGSIARARRAIGDRTTPYVSRGIASAHTGWLGASVRAGHVCELGERIRQLRLAAAAVVEAVTEQRNASTEASVYALRVAVRAHASARIQRVAADARGAALTEGRAALEALTTTRPWLPLPLDVDPMVRSRRRARAHALHAHAHNGAPELLRYGGAGQPRLACTRPQRRLACTRPQRRLSKQGLRTRRCQASVQRHREAMQ